MSPRSTHGQTYSREYRVWWDMLQRCTNKNNQRYARYGGRGIIVCERWKDFALFLADMGQRPSRNHSIDRIDNDGNYEPSNCRWATRSEQQRNKTIYDPTNLPRGDDHWTRKNRTRAQKIARKNIKAAHGRGEQNSNAKMSRKLANQIRRNWPKATTEMMGAIGRRYGVGRETIRKIIRGQAWL